MGEGDGGVEGAVLAYLRCCQRNTTTAYTIHANQCVLKNQSNYISLLVNAEEKKNPPEGYVRAN